MNVPAATGAIAVPRTASTPAPSSDDPSTDLLAAMRPAMDAAFAVGRPTDAAGAAAILATTGDYVRGAQATIAKVGEGIALREQQIAALQGSDPDRAAKLQEQVDLLERLRDRINLSIERVTRGSTGGEDDLEFEALLTKRRRERAIAEDAAQRRAQEQALLEQRRELLAADAHAQFTQQLAPTAVAAAYGSARST